MSKLHRDGVLSARERISRLLDNHTFVEIGALVGKNDSVITGYGSVLGRLVFVYAQDSSVSDGFIDERQAKKICGLYDKAMKMGATVVGFLDSKGFKDDRGFSGLGDVFSTMIKASGVIPQVTAIMGDCTGASSIIPTLSDFIFTVKDNYKFFLVEPSSDPKENGKKGDTSSKPDNSITHFVCDTEASCISDMIRLIDIIPSNNMEDAPFFGTGDDSSREDEFLNSIVSENLDNLDMERIIKSIGDNGDFIEVQKDFSPEVKEGFIRISGYTVGVIANNSCKLTHHSTGKALRFLSFCDSFNIPVVTLTDVCGFKGGVGQTVLIKSVTKLLAGFNNATCPKINVIVRNGFGTPSLVMNSKATGADIVVSWEGANVSSSENYSDCGFSDSVLKGFVDDVIKPSKTRGYLANVLEMLSTKRDTAPSKKHSSLSL